MPLRRLRHAIEPVIRPLAHLYWRLQRGVTLGARAVVIDGDGCVFLVKHSYVDGWHLPGGGVEPGESVQHALKRELAEEGNIVLTAAPVLHSVFFNPGNLQRDHVAVFIVREYRQESPPSANREIVAHGFFAPDELPADVSRATRARIAEVFAGTPVSDRW